MYTTDTSKPGSYKVAVPIPKKSILDYLKLTIILIIDICKIFGDILILMFKSLANLVLCRNHKRISGQLALVTGGGNGLGRQIAFELAKNKCDVAICDLDIIGAEQTAKDIQITFGVKCVAYKCDISDYDALLKLRSDILRDMGTPTILINNAALISFGSFMDMKPNVTEKVVNVNVTAQMLVC